MMAQSPYAAGKQGRGGSSKLGSQQAPHPQPSITPENQPTIGMQQRHAHAAPFSAARSGQAGMPLEEAAAFSASRVLPRSPMFSKKIS